MDLKLLTAADETGRSYPFEVTQNEGIYQLTLKKEAFAQAKQLYLLPQLSIAKAGDPGFYIVPRNLGLSGDLLIRFTPRENREYTCSTPIMYCFCVKTPSVTALIRLHRDYQYHLQVRIRDGQYQLLPYLDFTKQDPVYEDVRMEILPLDLGATMGDFAVAERNLRLSRGEIDTLQEKCRREPVEYARKYPLIRIRMGWKPSPTTVSTQTLENEPDMHIACTFGRVRDLADALKKHGVEGAELQLVGWNVSGHDGRYPQMFPVEPRLGGEAELKKTVSYVKSLGYRISLHTNSLDAYEIADTFDWDDVSVNRQGGHDFSGDGLGLSGGLSYRLCPIRQLKNVKRDLPAVAELGMNGLHYTDVTSIDLPPVCFHPDHPCSTGQGFALALENMAYTRKLFGGFSSEGCLDFSLPELDYGLYVSMAADPVVDEEALCDEKVPFFEVTYHSIVLYNPISATVNYPIKDQKSQLIFKMRGGRPSMYIFSKFRTGGAVNWMGETDLIIYDNDTLDRTAGLIAKASKEYLPLAQLQLVAMKDYQILDSGIHVAIYENGQRMIGNFTGEAQVFEGISLAAWDCQVL